MTAREALRFAAGRLERAGVPDAAIDAALLLSHVTGIPHLMLYADGARAISDNQFNEFEKLVARRASREPLQYITGETAFMELSVHTAPQALIPRSDTETLCEAALSRMQKDSAVLDLCTGTGVLAIVLKKRFPLSRVTASDLSADALQLAKENAARYHTAIEWVSGDLFAPFAGRRFDMIVCNPPYIPNGEMDRLQKEVLFEPHMALFGGKDGLDFYRRIAADAPEHLTARGHLLLEIGGSQAADVRSLLSDRFCRIETVLDPQGFSRVITAEVKG